MAALAIGAVAAAPFLGRGVVAGHDTLEYPVTEVLYAERLRAGDPFPAWTPYLSAGRGQPFFLYNPPLLFQVAAPAHLLGVHEARAVQYAVFALAVVAAAGAFLLGREICGPAGGAVAAAAFMTHPYVRTDLYARAAWTEFAALAFYPWVLASMVRLARGPDRRWLSIGALAWAGVGASHHPAHLILAGGAVIAAALLGSWRPLAVAAWGLAISAFAWLPALALKDLVAVDRIEGGYFRYEDHFLAVRQLVFPLGGPGYSRPGIEADAGWSLGPIHLVLAAIGAWTLRGRPTAACLALAAAGAFLSIGAAGPVWDAIPLLAPLAFPWRFHLLAVAGLAAAAAGVAARGRTATLAALALLACHLPLMRPYATIDLPRLTPEMIAAQGLDGAIAREFEPRGAPADLGAPVVPARFANDVNGPARHIADIFHFPGWTARLDGEPVPVERDAPTGQIAVEIPPGTHRLEMSFAPPPPARLARWVSVAALAGLALVRFGPKPP